MASNPYGSNYFADAKPTEPAPTQLVLDLYERGAVDTFLMLNRIVAGEIIILSLIWIACLMAVVANFPLERGLPILMALPAALIFLVGGIRQARLHYPSIQFNGVMSVMGLGIWILSIVGALRRPSIVSSGEIMVFGILFGLLYLPPIFVFFLASRWEQRGIRVSDLPRARYRSPNNPFAAN